jgi:hypothetical protein
MVRRVVSLSAVAAFSYEPRAGLPFRGVALCFKREGKGVLYAIASRRDAWSREEPVMKRMLGAFFYSGGGQQGEGGQEGRSSIPCRRRRTRVSGSRRS